MRGLDLGCGNKLRSKDILRVDINPSLRPDILHDLNSFPYPLAQGEFEVIYCTDVLEHLDNIVKVMEEIYRIAKPFAIVHITVPHFSCSNSYTDPTHKHFFGLFSFDYFTGENQWNFYTKAKFRKKKIQLIFFPTPWNKIIWRLANRYPIFYERYLTWVFPAWFMSIELEAIK